MIADLSCTLLFAPCIFYPFKSVKFEVTADTTEIKRIMRLLQITTYQKMDTLEEIDKFFKKIKPSRTEPGRNRKYEQTKPKY